MQGWHLSTPQELGGNVNLGQLLINKRLTGIDGIQALRN